MARKKIKYWLVYRGSNKRMTFGKQYQIQKAYPPNKAKRHGARVKVLDDNGKQLTLARSNFKGPSRNKKRKTDGQYVSSWGEQSYQLAPLLRSCPTDLVATKAAITKSLQRKQFWIHPDTTEIWIEFKNTTQNAGHKG